MDKHYDHMEGKSVAKRPYWLTLCIMATAASVIALSGCGDSEEDAIPAEEPSSLEQDATTQPAPSTNEDSAMEQSSGTSEDPAAQGMSQSEGTMPEDTMDEPAEGQMNQDESEPGFGEGTDPMPGVEDDESTTNSQ